MAAVTQVRILVTALLHFFIAPPCPSERGARTRGKSTQGIEPNPLMTRTSREKKNYASAGNRTRINCLEGSYADHYTTDAQTPESVLSLEDISPQSGARGCDIAQPTVTKLFSLSALRYCHGLSDWSIYVASRESTNGGIQTAGASIAQWQSVGLVNQRS